MEDVNVEAAVETNVESHGGGHPEMPAHHEPSFTVRLMTFIWLATMLYTLINTLLYISTHVTHALIPNIVNFLSGGGGH